MAEANSTPRERAAEDRARRLRGDAVRLVRRTLATPAGPLTRESVHGYAMGRPAPGEDPLDEQVLGPSPPPGYGLDFARPGGPEEAVVDAVHRRESGLPALHGVEHSRFPAAGGDADAPDVDRDWLPPGEFTTSSLSTYPPDLAPA